MTALFIAWLLAAQSAGTGSRPAPPATTSSPTPAVGNRLPSILFRRVVYDAEGAIRASAAYNRGEDFTAYVYGNTLCDVAGDSRQRPEQAGFGWEITGKFISRTPTEVIVELQWRRAWENGQVTKEPSGSVNLALHPGERVPLDRITTTAVPGGCRGVGMTLTAEFNNDTMISAVGAAGGGGGGRVGTGGGRGGGFGSSGGITNSAPAGGVSLRPGDQAAAFGSSMAEGPRSSARFSAEGVSATVISDFDSRTLQTMTVELWLVHRLPNGVEESEFRSVVTTPGEGAFEFSAVPVSVGSSPYSIGVKGFVQAQRLPDGTEKLDVGLLRNVTLLGASPRVITAGAAGRKFAAPQGDEVVSIELPPSETPALGGHQFSVRVRVAR